MYMALKRHILQEGERKKKEQRMEADAEAERIRKQREEANLRLRREQQLQREQEDNLTIEQLQQVRLVRRVNDFENCKSLYGMLVQFKKLRWLIVETTKPLIQLLRDLKFLLYLKNMVVSGYKSP